MKSNKKSNKNNVQTQELINNVQTQNLTNEVTNVLEETNVQRQDLTNEVTNLLEEPNVQTQNLTNEVTNVLEENNSFNNYFFLKALSLLSVSFSLLTLGVLILSNVIALTVSPLIIGSSLTILGGASFGFFSHKIYHNKSNNIDENDNLSIYESPSLTPANCKI